jgi:hypothetical protein
MARVLCSAVSHVFCACAMSIGKGIPGTLQQSLVVLANPIRCTFSGDSVPYSMLATIVVVVLLLQRVPTSLRTTNG